MAVLTVQSIVRAGLDPSYVAATGGGDQFLPGSDVFLHVKNGHTSAQTVTVVTPGTVLGDIAQADVAVSVPNADERIIGPFPASHFADSTDGLADITYSGVTALTIAAIRLTQP
jgi:hypothetical protein